MRRVVWLTLTMLGCLIPAAARAQTQTYHLHVELPSPANGADNVLKIADPDPSTVGFLSQDLINQPPGEYTARTWATALGSPNLSGLIPANSTINFVIWMKKTANAGVVYPRFKVTLRSATGPSLCSVTGTAAITNKLTQYSLNCQTTATVGQASSDIIFLWVGVNMTTGPGNHSVQILSQVEGTLNGNYDSRIVVPVPIPGPTVSGLSPSSGIVADAITITGAGFGASQGTSTVTFNGATATPSSWSVASITVPVPSGATSGPVVVTVGGVASNGAVFSVVQPPTITSLNPASGILGKPATTQ